MPALVGLTQWEDKACPPLLASRRPEVRRETGQRGRTGRQGWPWGWTSTAPPQTLARHHSPRVCREGRETLDLSEALCLLLETQA